MRNACASAGGRLSTSPRFDHIYAWGNNPMRRPLKGKRCRIVASGSRMHSVLLEFEDGVRIITSVRAIRRAPKS